MNTFKKFLESTDELQNFTGASALINPALRNHRQLSDQQQRMVTALDGMMHKVQQAVLYRVLDDDNPELEKIKACKVGSTYVDSGFMSTTYSVKGMKRIIADINDNGFEASLIVKIKVSANTRGINVNLHLKDGHFAYQDEIILERNTQLKLKEITDLNGIPCYVFES
jgi:hypothetical protein